jgi:hypothetical protein
MLQQFSGDGFELVVNSRFRVCLIYFRINGDTASMTAWAASSAMLASSGVYRFVV